MPSARVPYSATDCRMSLRKLELSAYSSAVSALRARGPLGSETREVLAGLRRALNIDAARHRAEARRVALDQHLNAVAEQVFGPNSQLEWVQEGRREVPIFSREAGQTMYQSYADVISAQMTEENKLIDTSGGFASPKSPNALPEEERRQNESAMIEKTNLKPKLENVPPVVMSDQSYKILADDAPPRKRNRTDASTTPYHITHQKHLNLSEAYSSYPKHFGKSHSRGSYSQSGKANAKSNHANVSKSALPKHRSLPKQTSNKHGGQVTIPHHQVRSGIKSPTDPHIAGSQALNMQNPVDANAIESQTATFQANYTPPVIQNTNIEEINTDLKLPVGSIVLSESPTLQLLTQPIHQDTSTTIMSEEMSDLSQPVQISNSNINVINVSTPIGKMQQASGKPCHLIIKKKVDNVNDQQIAQKIQINNKQLVSNKELSNIKVLQNRQVVLAAAHNTHKILNAGGKLITTKIVQQIPSKSQAQILPNIPHSIAGNAQVLIMPKSPLSPVQGGILQRSLNSNLSGKSVFMTNTPNKETDVNISNLKSNDPDGKNVILNNSDIKLSTKTFLLNSKSGQKMVVLPAKQTLFKNIQGKPTAMKLVTVGGQPVNPSKPSNVTVLSKNLNTNLLGSPKIISKETLASPMIAYPVHDSVSKVLSYVKNASRNTSPTKKIPGKGNVIVVHKNNALNETQITFSRSESDSRIEILKSQIIPKIGSVAPFTDSPVPTPSQGEISADNIVLMELSRETEMEDKFTDYGESEDDSIVQNDETKSETTLANESASEMLHNEITNVDSMESTADSLMEVSHAEDNSKSGDSCSEIQHEQSNEEVLIRTTTLSNFTDWELEVANTDSKQNDDKKPTERSLDLEMSSDSEAGVYERSQEMVKEEDKETSQDESHFDEQEDINEMYVQHSSIGQASRTFLSQLQDDGSSSNDAPFVLTKNLDTAQLELLNSSQTSSSAME